MKLENSKKFIPRIVRERRDGYERFWADWLEKNASNPKPIERSACSSIIISGCSEGELKSIRSEFENALLKKHMGRRGVPVR